MAKPQGRYRDHAPDTPISFLPNNAFVAQMCVLLGRNEIQSHYWLVGGGVVGMVGALFG